MPMIEQERLMEKLESLRGKVQPEAARTLDEAIEMAKLITESKMPALRGRFTRSEKPWLKVPEGYYTVQQVAERFGVSKQAVYKWIETGKIKTAPKTSKGIRSTLIPIDQFIPDQEEEQRAKLERLRQKISHGGLITVDEDDFPVGKHLGQPK